jgi:adenylyltransferase/sulfurtransferase
MVLNYEDGPTLRCLYPVSPHPMVVPSCEEFGVIGSVPGIIGSLQATEVLKIILGLDGILSGKIFMIDTNNFHPWVTTFERSPDYKPITELGDYEDIGPCDISMINEITQDTLRTMLLQEPGVIVIDLRDPEDNHSIGFKTTAIPYYDVSKKMQLFSQNKPVVFYCRSGSRSINVINYLQKVHNMTNLYSLNL